MEKAEVLRLFLEKGYQIDIESLNFFAKNEKSLQKFLAEIETKKFPSTITKEFVDSVLQSDVEIFALNIEERKVSAEEVSKILLERFNIIKKILITHLDLINLVSINKINQKMKKFSLIGIVSQIDETAKNITISDDTGEVNIYLEKHLLDEILVNDVLGFICEQNEIIHARNVVFPDAPLKRNVKNISEEKNVVFTEKTNENILKWCEEQKNTVYLFRFSHQDNLTDVPTNTKVIFAGEGPTFATLCKIFSVFLFDGSFLKDVLNDRKIDDFLVLLFRKRYFNATKKFNKVLLNNAFVVENIPDVVVVRGIDDAIQTNYKGTTLLTVNESTSWVINLKTREIIKLSYP